MRIGTLDRRIALQRRSTGYSNTGQPVDIWNLLAQRWANHKPMMGNERSERSTAAQWVGREQVQFVIRWTDDVAELSPLDRIIFPASDMSDSPMPIRSIYDIIEVLEVGRHDFLEILTIRHAG